MKKLTTFSKLLIFILFNYLVIRFILMPTSDKIISLNQKYEHQIGKDFVFKKDTLKIVDKSFWNETFTLENGVIINSQLVFNKFK